MLVARIADSAMPNEVEALSSASENFGSANRRLLKRTTAVRYPLPYVLVKDAFEHGIRAIALLRYI
jgi:hypothetical protein